MFLRSEIILGFLPDSCDSTSSVVSLRPVSSTERRSYRPACANPADDVPHASVSPLCPDRRPRLMSHDGTPSDVPVGMHSGTDPEPEPDLEPESASHGDGHGQSSERPVKKRASQACHHCRARKVKCDLVKSGIPCHNCKSDGIDCVIIESRRSRKYRLQKRQLSGLVSLPALIQAQPKDTIESSSAKTAAALDPAPAVSSRSNHGKSLTVAYILPRIMNLMSQCKVHRQLSPHFHVPRSTALPPSHRLPASVERARWMGE